MNAPHKDGDASTGVITGRNPVREALERGDGRVDKVMVQLGAHGSQIDAIRRAAKAAGVPVQVVPGPRLNHLAAGALHQGVVALASAVGYADLDEALATVAPDLDAVKAQKPLLVVLDEIEDPHNFGAILRSAVAAGAGVAVVPERHMAPLSATVVKASAGMALRIPVARVTNLAETLHALKERGYWVVGLAGDDEGDDTEREGTERPAPSRGAPERKTVWDWDWDRATAIVVGNEGRGLRPRVRHACDALLSIPMPGSAESLNASVAAGIALLYAARGRAAVPAADDGPQTTDD
ncbi:MAG TPA: 23S rRNA (guanosine(2251)-2'-O)-methyltransferase RlmB [Rhodothermales bacterium]|nr:23S rRNA (guanosine(2251)-2'-O)-methyltransferase RlmB [Rhodothermales bacterium]